jgi:nicotinamidase-related amidase
MLDIYSSYRRQTYIGEHPALLAVDLYNMAFQGGSRRVNEVVKEHPASFGIQAWQAIEPIKELLAIARSRKIAVIYTTTETRKEVNPAAVSATNRQNQKFDREPYEIFKAFKTEPNDLIVYKQRASAFFGTPLITHLRHLRVDSVIVCGESTSGCVRASVVDAFSYGFHVVLVEECCFDRIPLIHKLFLFDMHHKYADVVSLQRVKDHLGF